MNLIYHVHTRNMDEDKRKEFDRALGVGEPTVVVRPGRKRAPSWWHGDQAAAASSIAAARAMGFAVSEVT